MVPAMTHTSKKYLTFGLVLLATAIAGYIGLNYLEDVRAEVMQAQTAQDPQP